MDDSYIGTLSKPKKGFRRVFLDDSTLDCSPIRGNTSVNKSDGTKSLDVWSPRTRLSSEHESSSDDDNNANSVVLDSEEEIDSTRDTSAMVVPESPSIAELEDSEKESDDASVVDVAMKSVPSIVVESESEGEDVESESSVPSVVEESVGNLEEIHQSPEKNGSARRSVENGSAGLAKTSTFSFRKTDPAPVVVSETGDRQKELNSRLTQLREALKWAERLPDKGARLRAQLTAVEDEIAGGGDAAASSAASLNQGAVGHQGGVRAVPEIIQIEAGGDSVQVTANLKPQSNGPVNKWQLKQNEEYWQNKFAVDAAPNRLYGGRMTEAKQREAKIVTQDAIHQLHSVITACPGESVETKDPPGLLVPLLEHQRQALTWLLWREGQQPAGGILADDMGLGKTLTMIALILQKNYEAATSRDDECRKRVLNNQKLIPSRANLVVCPASVMHQWEKEIERRVKPGKLSILVYHGQKRETSAHRLARYDVVLTTYGTVASDIGTKKVGSDSDEEYSAASSSKKGKPRKGASPLLSIAWDRIILDEAHQIRNHTTTQSQACCKLPAMTRWAVTGTPLQNQLKDLYSLLKFLRYSPFDELAVWKEWVEIKTEQAKQRLNTIVKGIVLRRTKEQVSVTTGKALVSLPPKRFETEMLDFTAPERKIYDHMFAASRIYVAEILEKQGVVGQAMRNELAKYKNPFKTGPRRFDEAVDATKNGAGGLAVLVVILRLRQACVHLSLIKDAVDIDAVRSGESDLENDAGDFVDQFKNMSLLEDDEQVSGDGDSGKSAALFERVTLSTKINAVLQRLDHYLRAGGDGPTPKFVLVSQWVQVLDILAVHIKKRGIPFTSITGKVTPQDRSQRIEQFNNLQGGPKVMLLSLTAGGVGVNLIGGNHLFVIDLHWNPALEKQSCDRIYRVGQTRPVFIHKFVVNGTIEGRVQTLQENKLQLAEGVLSGTASKELSRLTLHDLKFLFGLSSGEEKQVAPNRSNFQPRKFF